MELVYGGTEPKRDFSIGKGTSLAKYYTRFSVFIQRFPNLPCERFNYNNLLFIIKTHEEPPSIASFFGFPMQYFYISWNEFKTESQYN